MAAVINTNIASLNTQRNLGTSQSALNTSIQRLSSGLRINSAKDDAAGLAISERMNAQVRGLNVAARNANDGISLAQTAEGALGKVGDMLQRMRELAVQSANATNSTTDRAALQAEVVQLKEEIGRVATTTKFNGIALLDGTFNAQNFQVGANAGETITLASVANAKLDTLGTLQTGSATSPVVNSYTATSSAIAFTAAATPSAIDINGVTINSANGTIAELQADLATKAAVPANSAALAGISIDGTGVISLASATNSTFTVAAGANVTGAVAGSVTNTPTGGVTTATTEAGIANLTVATDVGAAFAIAAIDTALDSINSSRGTLGAVQSRFESAIANIQVTSENLSAARSRIVDADFASETASLTRGQILQQAGTAMLAQANSLPNNVLSLLR